MKDSQVRSPMATLWKKLKQAVRRRAAEPSNGATHTFEARYVSFKELLAANTHLLDIMADIEIKLQGGRVFGMTYVRAQASRALFYTLRMVLCLNFIAAKQYLHLMPALEKIHRGIQSLLDHPKSVGRTEFVLPLTRVSQKMLDWVGGKNANLGEVCSVLQIPTPSGFAITTTAFEGFMAHNGLSEAIQQCLDQADPGQPQSMAAASAAVERLIMEAELPPDLEWAIAHAPELLTVHGTGRHPRPLAMRSSAVGEDSQWTFAGQYRSVLNVPHEKIVDAYRRVVAGLYTERAIVYRIGKGIDNADMAMGVAGLEMVPAVSSGVVYSRDPMDPDGPCMIINGVWGLGPYAVEGVIPPDYFRVDRDDPARIVEQRIAAKPVKLVMAPASGVREVPVAAPLREQPCLTPTQVRQLARWALELETHFGEAQDIEWALDPDGSLLVLQTRPLQQVPRDQTGPGRAIERYRDYPVLADHGIPVFPGVGIGQACHVRTNEDLAGFPQGAILVARRSSPNYVMVMPKARAIITEVGSVTGHMASLARELRVPTVLGLEGVMQSVAPGALITVDAYSGVVYQGRVAELENLKPPPAPSIQDLPSWQALRRVADWIVPLHLTDPKAPDFRPEACRSLHDIMRIVHELCYQEMFRLSDRVSHREGTAVKLAVKLPFDLYLIDLGGGLADGVADADEVPPEAVTSIPFKALLKGMLHPGLELREPRPIHLTGFFSVMREQILSPPAHVERFGDRSYAIIADKYLNFSSRVGYHYSILDCYCGASINKNYITFSFKGGAADDTRRNRRVRAIARILEALDFAVEVRADRVDARQLKYAQAAIEARLDQIGRLLLYTRQMDMLMNGEGSVDQAARSFLAGNYRLEYGPAQK
jgi:pyruvate,water dikinase